MHTTCELSADNSGVMHAATLLNSIRSAVAQYQHCQTVERVACRIVVVCPQCPVALNLPYSLRSYSTVSSLLLILFAVNSPAGAVKRHKS